MYPHPALSTTAKALIGVLFSVADRSLTALATATQFLKTESLSSRSESLFWNFETLLGIGPTWGPREIKKRLTIAVRETASPIVLVAMPLPNQHGVHSFSGPGLDNDLIISLA